MKLEFQRSPWHLSVMVLLGDFGWGSTWFFDRADGFPIDKGICRNVSSDVVVGSSGLLGDSRVAIQISSSLSMADVPDE